MFFGIPHTNTILIPIRNFRLLIILFLLIFRLHAGIDLRGQVDCTSSKVNNNLGVGSAIAGVLVVYNW